MDTQIVSDTKVSAAETVSPLSAAYKVAMDCIAQKVEPLNVAAAFEHVASLIGDKPNRKDFTDKDSFKAAMNGWDADRKPLAHLWRKAKESGYVVSETFGARGLKSGGVTFSHREVIRFQPQGSAWKL